MQLRKASIAVRKVLAQAPGASLDLDQVRLLETRLLINTSSGWVAIPYVWNAEQTEATLALAGDTLSLELVERRGSSAVRVPRAGHESVRGLSCARTSLAEDRADRHSRAPLEQDIPLRRGKRESAGALAEGRLADRRARPGARAAQRALGRSRGRRSRSARASLPRCKLRTLSSAAWRCEYFGPAAARAGDGSGAARRVQDSNCNRPRLRRRACSTSCRARRTSRFCCTGCFPRRPTWRCRSSADRWSMPKALR